MTGFFEKRKSDVLLAIFSRLQFGHLVVTFPDGARHEFTGVKAGPRAEMTIMDMAAISRILSDGKMGFCEAVMDGQIDSPSMSDLIELAVLHDSMLSKQMSANAWRKIGLRLFHGLRKNSKSGAARNISYHYDLGNDFYAAWLDRTMTYSSAVYQSDSDDLAVAQTNKYRRLADLADIRPGDHVLEIGCGWGGFAKYAIEERGARVTGITISREQHDFALNRLAEAGLADRGEVKLIDYRDLTGKFDKIVSIEMFEAVGQAYWETYFRAVSSLLKDGGARCFRRSRSRTTRSRNMSANRISSSVTFSLAVCCLDAAPRTACAEAGLRLVEENGFGEHYARTLAEWRDRFQAAWPELAKGKFDSRFKRMWGCTCPIVKVASAPA